MNKSPLKTGSNAYIEGINGRYIPCKVLSIFFDEPKGFVLAARTSRSNETIRNVPGSYHKIKVQVTKNIFGYVDGEVVEETGLRIIPEWALDKKLRRVLAFSISPDEVNNEISTP